MIATSRSPAAARLRFTDLARLAVVGLRTRKLRAALSALGIAIGVAAIVAVLGLSSSSAAGLNAEIAALGTNLLTVQPGNSFSGGTEELPLQAPGMISRLPGVYAVQTTATIDGVSAYRSPLIPSVNTNALTVDAASLGLPAARRDVHRPGEVPQRGHRPRAGVRAWRRRRATAGHRPCLPRRADLGREHVAVRRRDPQAGRAVP